MSNTSPCIQRRELGDWQLLPEQWSEFSRRLLSARGIFHQDDLFYSLADLPRPETMKGMAEATALLAQALREQWRVCVVADFDSDGATSCALAIRGLKAMGLQHIDFIVPNRFIHGYGLTPQLLDEFDSQLQPELLITVDNGIASHAGVAAAQQRGMRVLVTDHHLPAETLPDADAIINPNQAECEFVSKKLAGVGVCFYLLLGLRQHLRQIGWFEQQAITEPRLVDCLDIVALGTVADVVPLDKLNRTLVNMGLNRIRHGKACALLQALLQITGKQAAQLSATDLGFSLAPRLNAAGRMEDMRVGIMALLNDDAEQALAAARELDEINQQRRDTEADMQAEALRMLEQLDFADLNEPGICLYHPDWHQGIIGLLASRIKEQQHRPVIIFADGDAGEIRGSARSIAGIHIRDVLVDISRTAPNLLNKFGGHAMAAGMTIAADKLETFRQLFQQQLREQVDEAVYSRKITTDGELAHPQINLHNAQLLPTLAPWGQAFEEPRFDGEFKLAAWSHVGQEQNHLRMTLQLDDGREVVAMAFRQTAPEWLGGADSVRLVYKLDVNEFRQQRQLQLIVDYLLPAA
jgi:single-stranded-DNA-specific exonuclease